MKVPTVGWVRFRWSRAVADGVKSYRVTCDPAGRWHVAFAVVPESIAGPGTGAVVGVDRGVGVGGVVHRGVRQKAGLNRGILANGWGQLVTRTEHKAPGRVLKVDSRFTSQRCSVCGIVDRGRARAKPPSGAGPAVLPATRM